MLSTVHSRLDLLAIKSPKGDTTSTATRKPASFLLTSDHRSSLSSGHLSSIWCTAWGWGLKMKRKKIEEKQNQYLKIMENNIWRERQKCTGNIRQGERIITSGVLNNSLNANSKSFNHLVVSQLLCDWKETS